MFIYVLIFDLAACSSLFSSCYINLSACSLIFSRGNQSTAIFSHKEKADDLNILNH